MAYFWIKAYVPFSYDPDPPGENVVWIRSSSGCDTWNDLMVDMLYINLNPSSAIKWPCQQLCDASNFFITCHSNRSSYSSNAHWLQLYRQSTKSPHPAGIFLQRKTLLFGKVSTEVYIVGKGVPTPQTKMQPHPALATPRLFSNLQPHRRLFQQN